VALVDDLFDRLVFELAGVFRSPHLRFSISVFDFIICLLIWGSAIAPEVAVGKIGLNELPLKKQIRGACVYCTVSR
jgi:hypothetical protein